MLHLGQVGNFETICAGYREYIHLLQLGSSYCTYHYCTVSHINKKRIIKCLSQYNLKFWNLFQQENLITGVHHIDTKTYSTDSVMSRSIARLMKHPFQNRTVKVICFISCINNLSADAVSYTQSSAVVAYTHLIVFLLYLYHLCFPAAPPKMSSLTNIPLCLLYRSMFNVLSS